MNDGFVVVVVVVLLRGAAVSVGDVRAALETHVLDSLNSKVLR